MFEAGFEVSRTIGFEDDEGTGAFGVFFVEGLGEEAVLSIGESGSKKHMSVQSKDSENEKALHKSD